MQDALEELIAGRAESTADYAGCAYYAALQIIIDHNASDPSTLGSYRSPVTYFSALDDALRAAGVPADLLPWQYVFSGPPSEIGFRIPSPPEGSPEIGCWPLAKAAPEVEACEAVLDRIDADRQCDGQSAEDSAGEDLVTPRVLPFVAGHMRFHVREVRVGRRLCRRGPPLRPWRAPLPRVRAG
ncbi:hypothetical protein AB0M92_36525 [Streptomyces sp. NPDC051582]|uniref:DUF7691 family protein n=1 Tax=Streptomyces sp. NPDC051582 TaxID=3155167 RepID=UPI003421398C